MGSGGDQIQMSSRKTRALSMADTWGLSPQQPQELIKSVAEIPAKRLLFTNSIISSKIELVHAEPFHCDKLASFLELLVNGESFILPTCSLQTSLSELIPQTARHDKMAAWRVESSSVVRMNRKSFMIDSQAASVIRTFTETESATYPSTILGWDL